MLPPKLKIASAVFAALRFAAVMIVVAHQSHDAQWQLSYILFWIADFPISLMYHFLPAPWPEVILGPIWWFVLPIVFWGIYKALKARFARARG
jgi:hypothetical protein